MLNESPPVVALERETIADLSHVYLAFVNGESGRPSLALEDITLQIPAGEFCTIVGPSGCGKSTILNLLSGLIAPSDGTVSFRGAPVRGINTDVGYVTQDDNLLPWRTLQSNVEIALEFQGVPKPERALRSAELIARVGLAGFENYYPGQLSGGMRKRAAIIRTLIYDTHMILMDEPFGPLDAQTRLVLQNDLLLLWERMRRTVLFVTHDLVEAIALSDRIVVMSSAPGRIKKVYEVYDQLWADIRDEIRLAGGAGTA